jgi:hypothetical protein
MQDARKEAGRRTGGAGYTRPVPGWLASLLAALLPEPERGALVRRHGGDPPRASMLVGATQFVLGARLVHDSVMSHLRRGAEAMSVEFLRLAETRQVRGEEALGLTWGGAVLWLDWLLRPTSWLLLSLPVVGLLRAAAYLGPREAIAEPSVWAAARIVRAARRALGAASVRAEFGDAAAPDEVSVEGDAVLLVHTARPRAEWNDAVTIEVDGRFFRVARHDEVHLHGRRRHRYRLAAAGEHDVIRRLLRYELPPPVR